MKRSFLWLLVISVFIINPLIDAIAGDLVLYFSFDNDSGNVAKDLSKFKNNATFKGTPQWIPGKFGRALGLDGATHGEVPDSPSLDLTDALTVEAWALVEAGGEGTQSAVEKGNAWKEGEYNLAALYSGGTLLQARDLPADCADTNIGKSIQDGTWHFLAGTWDGQMIKLYIDGKLDTEKPCVGKLLTNDDPLFIGARGGTVRFLKGALDEIKVYNFALSADDLLVDMENPGAAVDAKGKLAVTWGRMKAGF
jgi:hypothetical protein